MIIVFASSRSNGNTAKVAGHLGAHAGARVIDLADYAVAPFNYDNDYPDHDDFLGLIEILLEHERIILASPVYWYTMSGQMKIFLDRFSDLLKWHKATGRRLRGRRLGVLSCANDETVNDSFYAAFRLTANYLGMTYGPAWHGWVEDDGTPVLVEKPH